MIRVTFSERAIDDLSDIGAWIEEQADAEIADAYVDRVYAACMRLSDHPRRGKPRDDLVPGLRSLTFEHRLLILYRVEGKEVLVVRVIHTARDLPAQFPEGDN